MANKEEKIQAAISKMEGRKAESVVRNRVLFILGMVAFMAYSIGLYTFGYMMNSDIGVKAETTTEYVYIEKEVPVIEEPAVKLNGGLDLSKVEFIIEDKHEWTITDLKNHINFKLPTWALEALKDKVFIGASGPVDDNALIWLDFEDADTGDISTVVINKHGAVAAVYLDADSDEALSSKWLIDKN